MTEPFERGGRQPRGPVPPPANECECRRLTLVDVPRRDFDPANPHHPSCEHYTPPPGASPAVEKRWRERIRRARTLGDPDGDPPAST